MRTLRGRLNCRETDGPRQWLPAVASMSLQPFLLPMTPPFSTRCEFSVCRRRTEKPFGILRPFNMQQTTLLKFTARTAMPVPRRFLKATDYTYISPRNGPRHDGVSFAIRHLPQLFSRLRFIRPDASASRADCLSLSVDADDSGGTEAEPARRLQRTLCLPDLFTGLFMKSRHITIIFSVTADDQHIFVDGGRTAIAMLRGIMQFCILPDNRAVRLKTGCTVRAEMYV